MAKPVTPRDLVKILTKLGFQHTRTKGSYHRFEHQDGRKTSVPIHGNEPIGEGLMNKIIKKDLKMGKKEFYKIIETV